MKLWLDDIREPWKFGRLGWTWVKTAKAAIEAFKTGEVEEASLDHDLSEDQMVQGGFLGKVFEDGKGTGYDVVCWLEENPQYWPKGGVVVHSANPAGKERMIKVLDKIYSGLLADNYANKMIDNLHNQGEKQNSMCCQ